MKISGFSYVRNGFDYGVPFLEAIQSVLPVCDEFVITVGDSNDGTRQAIKSLGSDKIRIIDTTWDMSLRKGGKIFAQQSNIALDATTGDWAFQIQADEVMHEKDLPTILKAIEAEHHQPGTDGFLFPFLHFWGDYRHVQNSRRVHRFEIRLFKKNKLVRSYNDSQGFRLYNSMEAYENGSDKGKKLKVKLLDTPVYHYNGVRQSELMKAKEKNFSYFYGHDSGSNTATEFNYHKVPRVIKFTGTHPKVMHKRISEYDYEFVHDRSQSVWKTKDRIIQPVEDLLGVRFGEYKNYKLIK